MGSKKKKNRKKKSISKSSDHAKPVSNSSRPLRIRPVFIISPVLFVLVALGAYYALPFFSWHTGPMNLLVITLDTTRADHLGCYGSTKSKTPVLDSIAASGMLFSHCTSCSPLTLPSHSSLFTSKYPYAHGARSNGTEKLAGSNLTLAEIMKKEGYDTSATVASYVINRKFGLDQGFDTYHDVQVKGTTNPMQSQRRGDEIAKDAIEMLQSLPGKPFFLWVHFFDPHHPYNSYRPLPHGSPEAYADEVEFMDNQIGRIIEELKRLDLYKNTLIVIMGDHGEGLDDHAEARHGYFLYDTTIHVPLIMHAPGLVPEGKNISTFIRTIDVAPTILDLLKIKGFDQAQGTSLVPLMNGIKSYDEAAYSESLTARKQFRLSMLRSITNQKYKYILAPKPELYDIQNDPGETVNIVDLKPHIARSMKQKMKELIAKAPEPPDAEESTASLSMDEVRKLSALGYVASQTGGNEQPLKEIDMFEPEGGNPADYSELMENSSRARMAIQTGQFAQAIEMLKSLIEKMPDSPMFYGNIAHALHMLGRIDEAISWCRRGIEADPDDAYVRGVLGELLNASGRHDEAIAEFTKALEIQPDNTVARYNLATALANKGLFDEALSTFMKILDSDPENVRVLHGIAIVHARKGRLAEAEAYFLKVLAIEPGHPTASRHLAFIRSKMNRM